MLKWGSDAPASAAAKRKRAQRVREADLRESEDPETKRAADAKRARELQEMRKASERRRALGKIWTCEPWCCDFGADAKCGTCLKPSLASPQPKGEWYVWICEECDWAMCRGCCKAPDVHSPCEEPHALICIDHDGDIIDKRPR